ncbi:MAG: hypothetical protein LUD12_12270 [Lachnospiraceae bacterium]|nr:hypothetical protein [Lachnospiraceae bacterium]
MKNGNYKIDKELEAFMPKLSKKEQEKLEESFKLYGYKGAPIFIWKEQGVIIDGHNRYELCEKFGYEPVIEELSFENKEQVIQWIIYTQLGRRNLPDGEMIHYARMLRPKLEQEAKERQRKAGGDKKKQTVPPQNGASGDTEAIPPQNGASDKHKNEVTSQLAEMAGMKREKFRMGEAVLNSDNEKLKEDMRNGTKTVTGAYKELKRQKNNDASAHELQRLKNSGREIHIPESCVENKPVPVVADTPESVEKHLKCLKNLTSDFYQKMRTETAWLNSKSIWTGSRAYPYQNKEVSRNISDWMYNFGKIYKQIMDMEPFQIEPERSIFICTSNEEDE